MRNRIVALACAAGSCLAASAWGQAGSDPALHGGFAAPVSASFGRHTVSLPGGAVVRATDNTVRGVRAIAVPGSSTVLMTWTESGPWGSTAFYAVSFDGRTAAAEPMPTSYVVGLRYMNFDPRLTTPNVEANLRAPAGSNLHLVQFHTTPLPELQAQVEAAGGTVLRFLADHTLIVFMSPEERAQVEALPFVRWVGEFHTAYKLDETILGALEAGGAIDVPGRYSIECFEQGLGGQTAVAQKAAQLGATVNMTSADGYRMEVTATPAQLLELARMDEVHFMDPWGPGGHDMNIVRSIGGANYLETTLGMTGEGVRGEVFDSEVRTTHQEFTGLTPLNHSPTFGNPADPHGTSVFSIVFGQGTSANARGLLPDSEEQIFYWYGQSTQFGGPQTRLAANTQLLAAPYTAVFQTSSIGSPQGTVYTTISAEVDNYLFLQPLLSTQSQSNTGNNNSRPQAWAKNIVSCGAVDHFNTLGRGDDTRSGTSVGPAADGRLKPDLLFFYDLTFAAANASNVSYTEFGGTSGATPSCGGYFGLFHQMWHEGVWEGRGGASSVFASRPKPTTAKAALCNTAFRYNWLLGGANGNITRNVQGWGMPDMANLHGQVERTFIVDQESPLAPLATHTYFLCVDPGQAAFNVTMSYPDPQGPTSATTHRINDVSLRVTAPSGTFYWGNNGLTAGNFSTSGGVSNTKDTVENVFVQSPAAGLWKIEIIGSEIVADGHTATAGIDAIYSIWATGGTPIPAGPGGGLAAGGRADAFNRADGPIGGAWSGAGGTFANFTVLDGTGAHATAANEQIVNDTTDAEYDQVTQWVDACIGGSGLQYVALSSGLGGTDNLFIKVQGSGVFDTCGIYHGLGLGGWTGQTGGGAFFAIPAFSCGRLRVSLSDDGDTVTLDIDSNFDGVADQTHSRGGVNAISSSFGTQFGIGAYGPSRFENWIVTREARSDGFNRADGAVGGEWSAGAGTFANLTIAGNKVTHTGSVSDQMIHSATASFRERSGWVDLQNNGTTTQFVALMAGLGGTDNLFIKLQNNGGVTGFNTCGFYHLNGTPGWTGQTGGGAFFTLAEPFETGRMRLSTSADGDTALLEIDTDFDGVADQSYARGGVNNISGSFGNRFGVAAYGTASCDNWNLGECGNDLFNRPDGPIGGTWAAAVGAFAGFTVSGNRGTFSGAGSDHQMVNNAFTVFHADSEMWMDVQTVGTGLQYVGLINGLGGTDNLFVKFQQQSASGTFEFVGIYHGSGVAGGWAGMTGGGAFFGITPFASGRVRVRILPDGDTVVVEIDSDFDGVSNQSFTRGGLATIKENFGTKVGVGAFAAASFDNFRVCPVTTESCYADCNGSGTLTVADFGCFQGKYVLGDLYADCNASGNLTVADFGCFQGKYVLGCP